eukprot:Skav219698  [mRNA]  locus=scaffold817:295924:299376:- [translate_table: standard]
MGLRAELAPRSFDSLERAEAKRHIHFDPLTFSSFQLHVIFKRLEVLHQDASLGIAGVLYDCALLLARRLVEEPRLLNGKLPSSFFFNTVLLLSKGPASLAGLRSLLNGAGHLFKECVPLPLQPAAEATLQLAAKDAVVTQSVF